MDIADQVAVDELRERVHQLYWVHQIDLGNGIVTPGRWPPHPLIGKAFDTIDFKGKRVLDIGCWDGLWAFEAERRGASEVVAIDDLTQRSYPDQPTFRLAHEVLRSRVEYHPDLSVYDLASRFPDRLFDVVLFCGVYYHLKDPLLALAKIRRVASEGARLIVEGDAIDDTENSFATFSYRSYHLNDPSNWWVPTIACLRDWVTCSFFDVEAEFDSFSHHKPSLYRELKRRVKLLLGRECRDVGRYVMVAKAVTRADPNYIFPDTGLSAFDLNRYA